MSIYSTLWRLQFPRNGDAYVGCEWVEVLAQGVPAHVGTPTPGSGYEAGDPYETFLPPALRIGTEASEDDLRALSCSSSARQTRAQVDQGNALAQGNPRVIYALLFRAAADTLLTFGRDPRHLGGTVGITAILHTWGQALTQHLHLHCLVTGGALAADHSRWIAGRSSFLFPVRAMSTVFRATYLAGLQRAYDVGELTFAGGTAPLASPRTFTGFLGQLRAVDWIVYAKRPFPAPSRCSTTWVGTRTAPRSRMTGSSITATAASASAGRTTPTTTA